MSADLDVETLRLLRAVAELGSLSAAAAKRGMSQPAASARVREFESRWRLAVVRCSPRGSQLTTDGKAIVSLGAHGPSYDGHHARGDGGPE